ncbi:MAG: hypothetical protein AAFW95_00605 [Cyanobacteria bacterium J06638_6]
MVCKKQEPNRIDAMLDDLCLLDARRASIVSTLERRDLLPRLSSVICSRKQERLGRRLHAERGDDGML